MPQCWLIIVGVCRDSVLMLSTQVQKTIFRCYEVTVLEKSFAFCAVYCHYCIVLFFCIAENTTNTLTVNNCSCHKLLSTFQNFFLVYDPCATDKNQNCRGRNISKTRADAKKPMVFSKSAPQIYPKTSLISEATNCMLTSVI